MTMIFFRNPHDQAHVVFDQEDGDLELLADAPDERHETLFFVEVQTGRGLVEQQQRGPGR